MIVGFIGKIGNGKTLLMSLFLHYYFRKGYKILTNYRLTFKHEIITPKTILEYKENNSLNNAVIGLDELHVFFDSRRAMTKKNRIISYFITQTRKRNVLLFYTTQRFNQVDIRIRNLTDYLVKCEKISLEDGNFAIQFHIIDMSNPENIKTFVLNEPKKFFKLYNTYEIIDFEDN